MHGVATIAETLLRCYARVHLRGTEARTDEHPPAVDGEAEDYESEKLTHW